MRLSDFIGAVPGDGAGQSASGGLLDPVAGIGALFAACVEDEGQACVLQLPSPRASGHASIPYVGCHDSRISTGISLENLCCNEYDGG